MRALAGCFVVVSIGCFVAAPSAGAQASLVGKPQCRPDDKIETGLQGQVPVADRLSGAAASGYWCNLTEIGAWGSRAGEPTHSELSGWANFDTYKHCAYFHDGNDGANGGGGTVVMDVSDPRNPKKTAYLTTPAMTGAWESLRVNARRGLLVADHQSSTGASVDAAGTSPLDVYDVSQDCAHPKLLFSGAMPTAIGHEGWFSPDGMVYYMASLSSVWPIDISDPRNPKELGLWEIAAHGGSISDDGTRGYICDINTREVVIVDTSEAAALKPNAEYREISRAFMPGTQWCQETYPVTYDGRPHMIAWGEIGDGDNGFGQHCPSQVANFARPIVYDLSDEKNPVVVSLLMNEVGLPENCGAISGDQPVHPNPNATIVTQLFVYGTHMCHPDRLHDPTILACAEFHSGVRVYDIRDPRKPKEIAYFNPGSLAPGDPVLDMAASRPVIRPDLGQIWYNGLTEGFHVLQFAPGVYPLPESMRCPTRPDWFVTQYNPGLKCDASTSPASCRTSLRVSVRQVLGARRARRLRSATIYVNGRRPRAVRGRALRRPITFKRLRGASVRVRVVARKRDGSRVARTRVFDLCG